MEKLIAYCGLDCAECGAYLATKNNDQALREKTAAEWSKEYNTNITADMLHCTGCTKDGVKSVANCSTCEIRICASGKGVVNCGACDEFKTCKTINDFFAEIPDEVKNQFLKNLGQ